MYKQSSVVFMLGTLALSGCYENFQNPRSITDPQWDRYEDGYAASVGPDDQIWAIYQRTSSLDTEWLRVSRSTDSGRSWDAGSILPPGLGQTGETNGAAIQADVTNAGHAYVVANGTDFSSGDDRNWAFRTTNDGLSWSITEFDGASDYEYYDHRIAQNPINGTVAAVFTDYIGSIQMTRSTNFGVSWSSSSTVANANSAELISTLGLTYLSDGTLVCFYGRSPANQGIPAFWVRRSTNDGASWAGGYQVNSSGSGGGVGGGDILESGTLLHAVWGTDANYKHATSSDGGVNWEDNTLLDWEFSFEHKLAGPEGVLVWAFNSYIEGIGYNLHYHEWDGSAWSARRRANNQINSVRPPFAGVVATSTGEMVTLWTHWLGTGDVYAAVSDPNDEEDWGVSFVDGTVLGDVQRRDPISFSYVVGNYTDVDESRDVWVTYRGRSNSITGTMRLDSDVAILANGETTLTYSGVVPKRAPHQRYDLTVYVGTYPSTGGDWDRFTAEVVP